MTDHCGAVVRRDSTPPHPAPGRQWFVVTCTREKGHDGEHWHPFMRCGCVPWEGHSDGCLNHPAYGARL